MSESRSSRPINRTDFVKVVIAFLGTVMGSIIGLPAISFIISPAFQPKDTEAWVPVGPFENFPIGIPTPFSFTRSRINGWEKTINSYGVFIIRKDESQVLALSNICTHLACRVSWHTDLQHYVSPCHAGHFDIFGNVISGPPPRPLDEFATKIEDGNLSIKYPSFKRK